MKLVALFSPASAPCKLFPTTDEGTIITLVVSFFLFLSTIFTSGTFNGFAQRLISHSLKWYYTLWAFYIVMCLLSNGLYMYIGYTLQSDDEYDPGYLPSPVLPTVTNPQPLEPSKPTRLPVSSISTVSKSHLRQRLTQEEILDHYRQVNIEKYGVPAGYRELDPPVRSAPEPLKNLPLPLQTPRRSLLGPRPCSRISDFVSLPGLPLVPTMTALPIRYIQAPTRYMTIVSPPHTEYLHGSPMDVMMVSPPHIEVDQPSGFSEQSTTANLAAVAEPPSAPAVPTLPPMVSFGLGTQKQTSQPSSAPGVPQPLGTPVRTPSSSVLGRRQVSRPRGGNASRHVARPAAQQAPKPTPPTQPQVTSVVISKPDAAMRETVAVVAFDQQDWSLGWDELRKLTKDSWGWSSDDLHAQTYLPDMDWEVEDSVEEEKTARRDQSAVEDRLKAIVPGFTKTVIVFRLQILDASEEPGNLVSELSQSLHRVELLLKDLCSGKKQVPKGGDWSSFSGVVRFLKEEVVEKWDEQIEEKWDLKIRNEISRRVRAVAKFFE